MDEIEKLKEKEKYQLLEILIFLNGTRLMCIKQKMKIILFIAT